jgi:hypothetical protein
MGEFVRWWEKGEGGVERKESKTLIKTQNISTNNAKKSFVGNI